MGTRGRGISDGRRGPLHAGATQRTADHLRHVGSLREVFPRAAATAVEAMQLILRDPVIPEGELTI